MICLGCQEVFGKWQKQQEGQSVPDTAKSTFKLFN